MQLAAVVGFWIFWHFLVHISPYQLSFISEEKVRLVVAPSLEVLDGGVPMAQYVIKQRNQRNIETDVHYSILNLLMF